MPDAPHSPCINVCSLDERGWCRGCFRTRDEIAGWIRMSAEQQWSVVRACDDRRLARVPAVAGG
jgi:predicted Fe-S protein YdhL (DUF1289 family)